MASSIKLNNTLVHLVSRKQGHMQYTGKLYIGELHRTVYVTLFDLHFCSLSRNKGTASIWTRR
mgnify:CR=1 FL=1|jgi:hypothetical protein